MNSPKGCNPILARFSVQPRARSIQGREKAMKRLLAAVAVIGLAGCNTVEGLGRDLQNIGGVISGTATGVQNASGPPRQPLPPEEPIVPDSCEPDANGLVLEGCPQRP
jgi:predicted small secreted protein